MITNVEFEILVRCLMAFLFGSMGVLCIVFASIVLLETRETLRALREQNPPNLPRLQKERYSFVGMTIFLLMGLGMIGAAVFTALSRIPFVS